MLTIILTVIMIMPGDKPDVSQSHEMSSLEECSSAARAWLEQDAKAAGVAGFASGCSITDTRTDSPGEDN